jgi:hypothetical protein
MIQELKIHKKNMLTRRASLMPAPFAPSKLESREDICWCQLHQREMYRTGKDSKGDNTKDAPMNVWCTSTS